MTQSPPPAAVPAPVGNINQHYLAEESTLVAELADQADAGSRNRAAIRQTAQDLVHAVRRRSANEGGIDAFLQQYDLSSEEGVLLMCIAEALLRIPDADTADRLIADKLTSARWDEHLGASDSLFVNASTWSLMLTGNLLRLDKAATGKPSRALKRLASNAGEPVVRAAMRQAMRIIGHQFVMGRTIGEALERSARKDNDRYRYSFDMLGEAALTEDDADRYFDAYRDAIAAIGKSSRGDDLIASPSISVKLSALHPRYEYAQRGRVMQELLPRLLELCRLARDENVPVTIDAEESYRLELSLELFEAAARDTSLNDYDGLGLAVQAYQRRARDVIDFVIEVARAVGRRVPLRLVKGAYWDTEIKHAQELGLDSYPVFTRKAHTDISYLACARSMLAAKDALYSQFATHNAHTLASILHFAGSSDDYEFQRLHGMGEELYEEVIDPDKFAKPCRVYAPVGSHKDLLPYLVRRLLENGANTSFVNRILDEEVSVEDIVADPIEQSRAADFQPHTQIPAPADLFGERRTNSRGFNLPDRSVLANLLGQMEVSARERLRAGPVVAGQTRKGETRISCNPADARQVIGECADADHGAVDDALLAAGKAQPAWDALGADARADVLERAADLFEEHTAELLSLCQREAGKTLPDAISELREAVDFLRYYAVEARRLFGSPLELPGPTGERNLLGMRGRGVFVCISPWNFPLAIFTGQVAAALASGNAVLAKPAEQTPFVAERAFRLLLEAGVPPDVLHFLPGDGATVGGYAVSSPSVAGVAFTGSTETARRINRTLAERDGTIPVFIAETGGLNAMFVDSSALPEQVVLDAAYSAFNSAGQRCSALRLLCVQDVVADRVIKLLTGYLQQLSVGDPARIDTDIGPVIDAEAKDMLEAYVASLGKSATVLARGQNGPGDGYFVPPVVIEIDSPERLEREVFGPVLHLYRYRGKSLAATVEAVNARGYGLTMGLHSRIDSRAEAFVALSGAGNVYINRNMIGAVVGVQPFGGRGLSGTGPKAGGPNYLSRFGTEYTVSNNVAAVGGNATLLSLAD